MTVAVVVTVRNEAATIDALLEALAGQTRAPDELILVDGGSTDGTLARAAPHASRLPGFRLLAAPGSNISQGRNHGIAAAASDVIAVTDAGCVPAPDWLERLVSPFAGDADVGLVSGLTESAPAGHLEACIGRCSLAFSVRIGGTTLFPTARTLAFRRDVWARVGGFPERLPYGEDTAFIVAAAAAARLVVAPGAVVRWRPRRSYGEVVRQFYHYAEASAEGGLSGLLHGRTVAQSVAGVTGLAAGLYWRHWLPWALLAGGAGAYLARKARQGCFDVPSWRTWYRVPLVLLAIHVGTMAGIVRGHARRLVAPPR